MPTVIMIRTNAVDPDPCVEKPANTLLKSGYKVKILAWDRESNHKAKEEKLLLNAGTVDIVRIGLKGQFSGGIKKNLRSLIAFNIFVCRWLNNNKDSYDAIHAFDFDTGLIASYCAKKHKKKLVYHIADYYVESHGIKNSKLGNIIKYLEDRVINNADATIICTEKRRKQIEGTNPKRLVIIHNTPDSSAEIGSSYKLKSDRMKIVYVGVFGKSRFIDKIAEIVSRRKDCEFHIGGFGGNMESYFETMAKDYENIFYYGKLPYKQTLALETDCDVLAAIYDPSVPNHNFAAPNKFYEALMLGKPVIMAKNTGVDEIVLENEIGAVIDYDVASLEKAIETLVLKKDLWPLMGRRARELYDEAFSWDVMEKRLLTLYSELL